MMKREKSILEHAYEYHDRGWNIIPIGFDKKPRKGFSWRTYQTERVTQYNLQDWFGNEKTKNMAVLPGKVSGGLACRDFDIPNSYESWANRHSKLADNLPTTKTPNGYHVYFRAPAEVFTTFDDGELRGNSANYCVLPPSFNSEGKYQWLIRPNGQIPLLDPVKIELAKEYTDVTERIERIERTEEIVWVGVNNKIAEAIRRTVPVRYGTRHHLIFEFSRYLYSMPEFTDSDPRVFRSIVAEWHRQALPNIQTKEIEETWIDFLKGWPKIRHRIGDEPIQQVFRRAVESEMPAVALEKYPKNDRMRFLVALCRELQKEAGEGEFFLACRTGAGLFDVTPRTISRWLFLLESDQIIKTIIKGGTPENPRKATRFKYVAGE